MDHQLLNKLESMIQACCVGYADGVGLNYESDSAAEIIAYEVEKLLEGVEIGDKDWTMICVNIQSGLAMAAAKAIRIIGASHGVIT